MRTIKFRAWVNNEYMAIQGTPDLETLQSFFHHYGNEKILMQFTGLYDKNGKEIYEGDILEDYLGRRKVVEYYQDGFWLNASLEGAEWSLRHTHKSSKIIGNIHENAELLNN